MRSVFFDLAVVALVADIAAAAPAPSSLRRSQEPMYKVSYDARPFYLINNMTDSPLKEKLLSCENNEFAVTGFSIGHRGGGTLFFPEETVESTMAGARMGAGILECDVAFTSDRGLVCRHDQCDLHSTTDILLHPELAAKCVVPFTPANDTAPASATCCTSDITEAEFKSLCGKQDGFNASATNVKDFQHGTPNWRTDLYATCGTVMTLSSYITLVDSFPGHRNFTPELKTPPAAYVTMPFNGYSQEQFARDMLNTFLDHGIAPERVWPQSFLPADVFQWIKEYPAFADQAVYLDEDGDTPETYITAYERLPELKAKGVKIIAPPFNYLLQLTSDNTTVVPSLYAIAARDAGLDIVT